jgi:hypothetical protein
MMNSYEKGIIINKRNIEAIEENFTELQGKFNSLIAIINFFKNEVITKKQKEKLEIFIGAINSKLLTK